MNNLDQFEEISYNLTQEIEYVIENTIGKKASEEEKEQFVDSLLNILKKQSKIFLKKIIFQHYESTYTPLQNGSTNFNNPNQINIIFSTMPYYPQNIRYPQMPINYMIPMNSYFNYRPYQQLQNPIFMQPIPYSNQKTQKSLKNRSSKSHSNKSRIKNTSKTTKKGENSNTELIEKVKIIEPKKETIIKAESQIQNPKTTEKVTLQVQNSKPIEKVEWKFQNSEANEGNTQVISCPNGILNYLMEKVRERAPSLNEISRHSFFLGGKILPPNIHDNGTICISSNSVCTEVQDLLDLPGSIPFLTLPQHRNVWIMFDFKCMEVKITSYSITSGSVIGIIHNWTLETSSDERNWAKIDQRFDDNSLNYDYSKQTFDIKSNSSFARYARISFTDIEEAKTGLYNYAISIKAIEFYGDLKCH